MPSDTPSPSKFGVSWPWAVAIFLVFFGLIVLAFRFIPGWVVDEGKLKTGAEQLKAENDVRTAALQVIAGLVVATGLVLTARSVALTARSVELSRESLEVMREGQVTERLTRAIEQLGHERHAVRIGGIYGLERVAKDSSDDRETVLDVVTAYIREHAQLPAVGDQTQEKRSESRMRGDIAAGVNVVRRWRWGRVAPLELRRTALLNANLSGADLSGAKLSGADLSGADLSGADLSGADLSGADLSGADLSGADLSGADLSGADLSGRADLSKARMFDANLSAASLSHAHLFGTDLPFANLPHADLSDADLSDANLSHANLFEADLTDADLSGANLSDAALSGAMLDRAGYTEGNEPTQWPDGFKPKKHGAVPFTE